MKIDRNYCKTCREFAGLTQEQAVPFLGNISVRRLSDYENGADVPDDMIALMVEAYNAPLLAWWHLKYNPNAKLGKYLPEIQMPQTSGDMGLNVILASDGLKAVVLEIKEMLEDGAFTSGEYPELAKCVRRLKAIGGRILSAATYAEQEVLLREQSNDRKSKTQTRRQTAKEARSA